MSSVYIYCFVSACCMKVIRTTHKIWLTDCNKLTENGRVCLFFHSCSWNNKLCASELKISLFNIGRYCMKQYIYMYIYGTGIEVLAVDCLWMVIFFCIDSEMNLIRLHWNLFHRYCINWSGYLVVYV